MFVRALNRNAWPTTQALHPVWAGLLDDAIEHLLTPAGQPTPERLRSAALDVSETDQAYTVTLEIPGVAKEDVKVQVLGRQVTVRADRTAAAITSTATTAADPANQPAPETPPPTQRFVYRERAANRYERSFELPLEVDQAAAQAKLEQGVLTLTLPKRQASGAAQLTVN